MYLSFGIFAFQYLRTTSFSYKIPIRLPYSVETEQIGEKRESERVEKEQRERWN